MAGFIAPSSMPVPLREDHGVFRVGNTRVTLDTVVGTFNLGETPEEIVLQYPGLVLSEVYAVVSYYLQHREEIDAYLTERSREAAAWEAKSRSHPDVVAVRERLLSARRRLV